jgi:hypothetical protein
MAEQGGETEIGIECDNIDSYATVAEARAELGMGSQEFSEAAVQQMLDATTAMINLRTGRTWAGETVVTDEYYDGNGTQTLYLDKGDITELTSISVDTAGSGSFTSITTSKVKAYTRGKLQIDSALSPEVTVFTEGPQRVKVSYKYGKNMCSPEYALVKRLCILAVGQAIKHSEFRKREMDEIFNNLKQHSIAMP